MTAAIEVYNLSHAFGHRLVLRNLSFTLEAGGLHGLIGPSAGGKSVLLKILAGILEPSIGIVKNNIAADTGEISLMFQAGALFDSLTVLDNVAFPLVRGDVPLERVASKIKCRVTEEVSQILAHVGLSDAAYKVPGQLSGGMRRRASLARALVGNPKLVLLDDPTFGLDPIASAVIMNLIVEFQRKRDVTMLVVSQDLRRLLPICTRIWGLFDGQMRFSGTRDELRGSPDEILRQFVACRSDLINSSSAGLRPAP
jgi:phospholipid/cholesterol/gamma-HCH transport system ATP-binding protein